jgi:hypothetical protein
VENGSARRFEVELPVGYVDDDGRLHKVATLRKMTGHEEALLGDRKLRQNGGRLVTEVLSSCVKQVGEVQPVTPQMVSNLTSADRNYLLLELRKITFGDEIESSYVCPVCGETTRLTQDLNDLPVRKLNGEGQIQIAVELDDGYEDRAGEVYRQMVFRLPNGVDEERVAAVSRDNPSRGMTALLTRCLVALGDMPQDRREGLGTKVINDLTMADRACIEQVFRQEMPGINMAQEVECGSCARRFPTTLDLTGFFSLAPKTRRPFGERSST